MTKDGRTINMQVRDFVPYLIADGQTFCCALPGMKPQVQPQAAPEVQPPAELPSEPPPIVIAPEDDDDDDEADQPQTLAAIERQKLGAVSPGHMACHLPKNQFCPVCVLAKARSKPARRLQPGDRIRPQSFELECTLTGATLGPIMRKTHSSSTTKLASFLHHLVMTLGTRTMSLMRFRISWVFLSLLTCSLMVVLSLLPLHEL